MKTLLFLVIIAITCTSCAEPINVLRRLPLPPDSKPLADGWVAHREPWPESDAIFCGNYSNRRWKVALDGENLQITPEDRSQARQDPWPPGIVLEANSFGDRHVIAVSDGWLIGFDAGEFGSGLWWLSSDGSRDKSLSYENVNGFARTSQGVLAFVGLSHMGFSSGQVLRIADSGAEDRKVEVLADLGAAPDTFVVESPDTVLVLTTTGLVRVTSSGEVQPLFKTNYSRLYPKSMTLSQSGVITVGMQLFVTRLTPRGNTYREQWFVPKYCARFVIRDVECECIPGE